jgi:prevent-host-death family protein
MAEIGAFEAKNRLGALLDRAERGEEIVITRRGKPVAKLIPAGPGFEKLKHGVPLQASWKQAAGCLWAGLRSKS